MNVLVLKTDINSLQTVETLSPIFNNHVAIKEWSVDTEDRHNVLRVEAEESISESDIIQLIGDHGYNGSDLDC